MTDEVCRLGLKIRLKGWPVGGCVSGRSSVKPMVIVGAASDADFSLKGVRGAMRMKETQNRGLFCEYWVELSALCAAVKRSSRALN